MSTELQYTALNNQTIAASGNSDVFSNVGQSHNPEIVVVLDVQGPVTGTTPSLTVSLYASADGVRFEQVGILTAVTGVLAAPSRVVIKDVLEPYLQVQWVVSGTTPSFGGVNCNVFMSGPIS